MGLLLRRLFSDDSAQDLIEYALLSAFISIAVVGAVAALGAAINTLYQDRIVAQLP